MTNSIIVHKKYTKCYAVVTVLLKIIYKTMIKKVVKL